MPTEPEAHQCHFCGTWVQNAPRSCYAYQDSDGAWTDEHTHFYPDGPM